MPTHAERRPRSLEVQRAQAEERRQRLEEQRYQLQIKQHDLEKAKIVVGVLKHFTAVILAILFIWAYFGNQIVPAMRESLTLFLDFTAWDMGIVALAGSLAFALQALVDVTLEPEPQGNTRTAKRWLAVTMWLLLVAVILMVAALLSVR